MRVVMPFIISKMQRDFDFAWAYDGIMGFSPEDESAGPLFIDYLYRDGKL
jgi:hypothetical protein